MAHKSTRRDFLTGKAASDALGKAAPSEAPIESAGTEGRDPAPETYLIRVTRRAMACEFQVVLNAGQYPNGTEVALEALDLVEALESQLSFFRPSSDISRINLLAAGQPVEVEPRLFDLLQLALKIHAETDRAFDITATPLWEIWGFSRHAGRVPSDEELAAARPYVGSHLVELDPERKTIRLKKPGVRLSLGSIGKGYALDRCADLLDGAGVHDYLIHGGQSSVLARGTRAGTPDQPAGGVGGWSVGVPHPLRKGGHLGQIQLQNRALATSGSTIQFFRHKGRRYGHILDPRTGCPVEGVLSVTALAPTAAQADALSTAFYVVGAEGARQYCQTRPEIAAVLVCPSPGGTDVEVVSIGLAEGELRI
jgi:thiamine biosynthesis lipoprotein